MCHNTVTVSRITYLDRGYVILPSTANHYTKTSDVVVNQLVLFTMLQSFFRIPEE